MLRQIGRVFTQPLGSADNLAILHSPNGVLLIDGGIGPHRVSRARWDRRRGAGYELDANHSCRQDRSFFAHELMTRATYSPRVWHELTAAILKARFCHHGLRE